MLKSRSPGGCLAETLILFHFLLREYQSLLLEFQLIFPAKKWSIPSSHFSPSGPSVWEIEGWEFSQT